MFGDGDTSILDDYDYYADNSNKENVPGPSSDDGSSESVLESTPKKRRVENTCKALVSVKRFKEIATEDKIKEYSKGYTSANTKANTGWAPRDLRIGVHGDRMKALLTLFLPICCHLMMLTSRWRQMVVCVCEARKMVTDFLVPL